MIQHLSFVLALTLLVVCYLAPRPLLAQTPDPPQLGFHVAQGNRVHLEAAQAAGGQFVVLVFSWADIEPEPNYRYWEEADAALRAAEFYGLEVIARLDQPPAWASDSSTPTPWNLAAYTDFTRRVAERYADRLVGLIVWNEPNLNVDWAMTPPDAAGYAAMLQATYPVVKAVAPDLPVGMAGLSPTEGEGDWAINDLDYLQALYEAGVHGYFDVFTAHAYGFGRPPDDGPQKYRPNFRRLETYHQIMTAHGDGERPMWVTEVGWLTWATEARHEWQVVTPEMQAEYILGSIDYAAAHYPWVERLGLWQLNTGGDAYGYGIWHGADDRSLAYDALVERAAAEVSQPERTGPRRAEISLLAADTPVRLGDRETLHPHWVHVRNGRRLRWQTDFFLSADEAAQLYDLYLETMQIDQSSNRVWLNGQPLGRLRARPRPDPTSTWVTQRLVVPFNLLQTGVNSLTIESGLRNPTRQYIGGRWENMQVRHVRLTTPQLLPPPLIETWQPLTSPSGWAETNRLRRGVTDTLWLTGIRPGQLWQIVGSEAILQADSRSNVRFNDLLETQAGQLAATHDGLLWRPPLTTSWQAVTDAPAEFAYTVIQAEDWLYAGFEQAGLWQAESLQGPWQRTALTVTTVTDLLARPALSATAGAELYALTDKAVWVRAGAQATWQAFPLPPLSPEELDEAGENAGDKFKPRLFLTAAGEVVVRHQDRLWRQNPTSRDWALFGPEALHGKLFSLLNCCAGGTLVGSHDAGLWQSSAQADWQRVDDGLFDLTDVTELASRGDTVYAAGDLALFYHHEGEGQAWSKIEGLPATITDLLIDPTHPTRWLAATPVGLYRSDNRGERWQAISPLWTVWDMAYGPTGRLFVGRRNGLMWTDDVGGTPVDWQAAEDMNKVYFLKVIPHPADGQQVGAGTWGNNLAVSDDGGELVKPLHNGLETLSGLDLIWHPTPGQLTLATFAGLYRSDDFGQSWFKLPGPLMAQTVYSLLQTDEGTIWAGATDGLWLSRDYGGQWSRASGLPRATVINMGQITLSSETLWVGTEANGLWLSQDGGATWQFAGLAGRSIYNVVVDPLSPSRLIVATDGGIFVGS